MTIPEQATNAGPAASGLRQRYGARLVTMRKRSDFQRLRGGVRWSGTAFLIEGKPRLPGGPPAEVECRARFGFTITKKIGKAHERNRMRRRLSHAIRLLEIPPQLSGWDVVIVARRPSIDLPFPDLLRDFKSALRRLAQPSKPARSAPSRANQAGG